MMKSKKVFSFVLAALGLLSATNAKAGNPTKVTHTDWSRNAVIYEVNIRQITPEGTFTAFSKQLPRLKSLGTDILWIMPINPISVEGRKGKLGSYYAVQDYTKANPEFGSIADFRLLVKKAHAQGLKVIIDWVANHTGLDNVWVKAHPDYYAKDSLGKMISPFDWTDTYKLNYANPALRKSMIDAMKFWVKECDIDGFRCDVAMEVPTDFWNSARAELNKMKPIFMLAEAEKPELADEAFDMNYNWPLKNVLGDICKKGADAQKSLDSLRIRQNDIFPAGSYLMNHITNHDLNSWEGTEFVRLGEGVKPCAVLTYTLPGMPLLYTGQEVGFNHAFQFFEKDKSPDFTRNTWTLFYQRLNTLKHKYAALRAGDGGMVQRYPTKESQTYVFSRKGSNGTVLVMVNLSAKDAKLTYTVKAPAGKYMNYFSTKKEAAPTILKAWEYRIYIK